MSEPEFSEAEEEAWGITPEEVLERISDVEGAMHVDFEKFADMLGIYGEAVRDPAEIRPALERARASGGCAIINCWLDPDAYAPGTENQTMYR